MKIRDLPSVNCRFSFYWKDVLLSDRYLSLTIDGFKGSLDVSLRLPPWSTWKGISFTYMYTISCRCDTNFRNTPRRRRVSNWYTESKFRICLGGSNLVQRRRNSRNRGVCCSLISISMKPIDINSARMEYAAHPY